MKQFIVLIGILPIMLIFMIQFTYDQNTNERIAYIQNVVYFAKEDAKQAGGFTEEIKERLINDISKGLDIPKEYISINSNSAVKKRYLVGEGRLIEYEVKVRLDNIMAGGYLMGIDEEQNYTTYVIKSYTASEKL